MTNGSEPRNEPYDVGDRVRVQLDETDGDARFHGAAGRVVHVFAEDSKPDAELGADSSDREMDRAAYRLEDIESGDTFPVVFRHRDLRPVPDPE